jgi:hypothetical protein
MKLTLVILLSFLLFSLSSYSQKISLNGGGTKAKNYLITLPYEVVGGGFVVKATVKGKEKRFVFDTGAPMAVQQSWYSQNDGQKIKIGDANNNTESTGFAVIDSVNLGGVIFENIPAVVLKGDDIIAKCLSIDGFIGSNLLRNSIVQFDTDRKLILITDNQDSLKLSQQYATKMRLDNQSNPLITIKINDKESEIILFDSGSDGFYDQSYVYILLYNKQQIFSDSLTGLGSSSIGLWGVEKPQKQQRFKIPSLKIGDTDITNTWTTVTQDWRSRVGLELLNYGKVTIDYRKRKFYFEPKTNPQPYKNESWPVSLTAKDGKVFVGMVWSSVADKVKLGDEVIEIDGQTPKANSTICDMILDYPLNNKQSATLKLKSADGVIKTVKIEKQIK